MQTKIQFKRRFVIFEAFLLALVLLLTGVSNRLRADSGSCNGANVNLPFTDVAGNAFFCQIAEAYFSGLTNGTTATTYSPSTSVAREQMAAFVTRTLDQSLKRGSQRAALGQFWQTKRITNLNRWDFGNAPFGIKSDGQDLWVANSGAGSVFRLRSSTGELVDFVGGMPPLRDVLIAGGQVFVTAQGGPGRLYRIDPKQSPLNFTPVISSLPGAPMDLAFDGEKVWVANDNGSSGSVSLVDPLTGHFDTNAPLVGLVSPRGLVFDGTNMWITDRKDYGATPGELIKLDAQGNLLQHVTLGGSPQKAIFDGVNIWVPNQASHTVSVVRAATGVVIATLSGNGLNGPMGIAFDGERILVANLLGHSLSLWRATDLAPLGTVSVGADAYPTDVCSDGINFFITLNGNSKLVRF